MILQLSFNFNQMQKKERFNKVEFFDVNLLQNWLVGNDGHSSQMQQNRAVKTFQQPKLKPKR
ncbi:MAG: hypothetical protein KA319_14165 [Ferruginibacter sp.]|nr:hypothetical protein [Ferruginibacter sp.]